MSRQQLISQMGTVTPLRLFAATLVLGSAWMAIRAQTRSSAYPEYQVTIVTNMTSETRPPSDLPVSITTTWFGRSDGSKGTKTVEVHNGRPCTTTTTWDNRTGLQVTASDCVRMKNSAPFTSLPFPSASVETCAPVLMSAFKGPETIGSLKVERFEEDGPSYKSTGFYAPSLGCLRVRAISYAKAADGHVKGTSTQEPVEVKLGTPDPTLFAIPDSYREVLPSERRNALSRYYSGLQEAAACLRLSNEKYDKAYLTARKQPTSTEGTTASLRKYAVGIASLVGL